MRIIILEDNENRRCEMQAVLQDKFPAFTVEFFEAVPPMIHRLDSTRLYDVGLISLDHDLELIESPDGAHLDPGTGIEIAEWLARQPAVAPVIVHTTNSIGGDRMVELLRHTGWKCDRVSPYGGEVWIAEAWLHAARQLIVAQCPALSIAEIGLRILKRGIQNDDRAEDVIAECIRAARSRISGSSQTDDVSIQLLYFDSDDRFSTLVPGDGILEQFGLALMDEEFEGTVEMGPCPIERLPFSAEFIRALQSLDVKELQIDVIRLAGPEPLQALIVVASLSDNRQLGSHHLQATLSELRSLIELTILIELQKTEKQNGNPIHGGTNESEEG